jgi:O-antigen/teichoic acid export membrane protein
MLLLAGLINGLSRDLPYQIGKGEVEGSNKMAGTALLFVLLSSGIVVVAGIATALFVDRFNRVFSLSILTITLVIVTTFYSNYLTVTFRSAKSFVDMARLRLVSSALILLTLPLIIYFNYLGLLARVAVLAVLGVLFMHYLRPIRVHARWDSSSFSSLLRTGLPIFALDYVATSASTVDRLTLLNHGGLEAVGLFALAVLVRDAMAVVATSLNEYVYPRMSHAYGKDGNGLQLWYMGLKANVLAASILSVGAVLGWMALPIIVERFFPKYIGGVSAARLVLVAAIFSGATIGKSALWSMKKVRLMTSYQVLAAAFSVAGPLVGVKYFESALTGVSVGYLVAQILLCPVAWGLTYMATHQIPRVAA